MDKLAVELRNGYKYYGNNGSRKVILNYLNMSVQPGIIYGLLGASGCGKTTLLSCIVGQGQLQGGNLKVLGLTPGNPDNGLAQQIGFMPQEIALGEGLTVEEIVFFFGRIYGLSKNRISEKYHQLSKLLELPPSTRLVTKCSGGQQRRVSFACAMIHDPKLLILDEPTVGLDPLLRERIWEFLVDVTRKSTMAVIITTHYIEEARNANCIGLMRQGVLLAEDSPTNIMIRFGTDSLEDAFLVLSQRQGDNDQLQANLTQVPVNNMKDLQDDSGDQFHDVRSITDSETPDIRKKRKKIMFEALLRKSFTRFKRNMALDLTMTLLLPFLQIYFIYVYIGKPIKNVDIAVINEEIPDWRMCYKPGITRVRYIQDKCYLRNLSCDFMRILKASEDITPKYYDNADEAYADARKRKVSGYIHIPSNFSLALQERIDEGFYVQDFNVDYSEILVRLDMSDGQITYQIEKNLRDLFGTFIEDVLGKCQLSTRLATVPVKFMEPIYGQKSNFQQFIAPGIVFIMSFFFCSVLSTQIFIEERADGIWNRTLIAGASKLYMLGSHMIIQSCLSTLQAVSIVAFIAAFFDAYNNGSMWTLTFLFILNGWAGMIFGMMISVYSPSFVMANFTMAGAFYFMVFLCGILWPMEGMVLGVRYLADLLPFTQSLIAARNIIEKGWGLAKSEVLTGFGVLIVWIFIFLALIVVGLRRKI